MAATENAIDIASLKTRVDGHTETLSKFGARLDKHEESIAKIRENMARVATRDDVAELRTAVNKQFFEQLTQARNSIPGKMAAIASVVGTALAVIGFLVGHYKG
ncbi:hypothetical protein JAO10_01020 [Burkholderia contaminans]|uniref:hypothetical protein n=1 Tax=Burkholderia contaminans TaxID=488447 RepID=UPI0018DDA058|nr:hypothetical protein [Burkholderia contaminans]MBH9718897.1 hypothetical protein [Burkholderia contaminans]